MCILDLNEIEKPKFEIDNQVSWQSGQNYYCGYVRNWVDANRPIESITTNLLDLPSYRRNLGRSTTAEDRVIVEITHKFNNGKWEKYPYSKFSSFSVSRFEKNLKQVKEVNHEKHEKDDLFM